MIRLLLAVAALVGIATSLRCHSCDSFQNCARPYPVECPAHAHCYTITRGNEVLAKGCARDCDNVNIGVPNSYCTSCHHRNFCNGENIGIGQGFIPQETPGIGGGVVPNVNQEYEIGRGVRPRAATQATFGMLLTLPIFRYFLL